MPISDLIVNYGGDYPRGSQNQFLYSAPRVYKEGKGHLHREAERELRPGIGAAYICRKKSLRAFEVHPILFQKQL